MQGPVIDMRQYPISHIYSILAHMDFVIVGEKRDMRELLWWATPRPIRSDWSTENHPIWDHRQTHRTELDLCW